MAVKKAKRKGPKHPGVVLIKPIEARRIGWRARFKDPDTGKSVDQTVPAEHAGTLESRQAWAVAKSQALARRKIELAGGAARATGTTLVAAIERYYRAHPQLRPATVTIYRRATAKFLGWAASAKITSADKLTRAHLMDFRAATISEPQKVTAPGGKRGEKVATDDPRSAGGVNGTLRAVRTVLGYVRDLDLFPKLTHDDLRRGLKRLGQDVERPDYLSLPECRALLEAAIKHDAQMFTCTIEEHQRLREIGTTPRFEPIAPYTLFVLFTGCRSGEAVGVRWEDIDLSAADSTGAPAGEVRLRATATKTHRARQIGLEVAPSVREMLTKLRHEHASGSVFDLTAGMAKRGAERLIAQGAPKNLTWQLLRRTCGTYLTNAPGIFGAASVYRSAMQLGHSVEVAQKHYLGLVRGIPATAKTLEAAMGVEDLAAKIVTDARAPSGGTSGGRRGRSRKRE